MTKNTLRFGGTTTKLRTLLAASAILLAAPILYGASPGALLYVSDADAGVIYTYTPSGVQSTFASGLHEPEGLAFDAFGNLYEADFGSGNVYKFTPEGVQSTFASGLSTPQGLAFDAAGNLYVSNTGHNIYKFTPSGVQSTFVSSGLTVPIGLAFDAAGNLYVGDNTANHIYEYTPPSTVQSTFASSLLSGPEGLAFDAFGNLYVAGFTSGTIEEYSPTGAFLGTFANNFSMGPKGLAFDAFGNLYEANSDTGDIYAFTPGGVQSTFATGLMRPTWLAFGPVSNIQLRYVTHLDIGDSDINISNDGSSEAGTSAFTSSGNGNLCVGVYTFDANEELQSCCSCLVTPNGLVSLSAKAINASNLTGESPTSLVIKLLAWSTTAGASSTASPGTPAPPTSTACNAGNPGLLNSGLQAWGTTVHALPVSGYTVTETPFSTGNLSAAEFAHITQFCEFNQINGSAQSGQCKGCASGGQ